LVGRADASIVSFLAPRRAHTAGQLLPITAAGRPTAPDCLRPVDFGLPRDAG
jgi:hypothetical protein